MNVRVYFNRWADKPFIWSVDLGSQDTEVRVSDVHLNQVSGQTEIDESVLNGDKERPRVWIRYTNVGMHFVDGEAFIWRKVE